MEPVAIVPGRWLADLVAGVFGTLGFSPGASAAIAEDLVDADLRGISSHGVMLTPIYADRVQRGSVSRLETFDVVVDRDAVAVLDAGHGLGQLSSRVAMDMATERALAHGVGAVTVRRAHHFGAAGRHALRAAERGCIGIACSNTTALMPAPGGASRVLGNNPVAMAVPTASGPPLLLDMALSAVALNRIRMAERAGTPIPDTWATDSGGIPTTDPAAAIAGMLLPAGGHKGFGLALMVEVLTSVLSGGAWSVHSLYRDPDLHNDCSHFFMALDVAHFMDADQFQAQTAQLGRLIRESPPHPGVEAVHAPGDGQWRRRLEQLERGVAVSPTALVELQECARRLGVDASLPQGEEGGDAQA
ncbi:MAG TPA: Ldh family oxidoreductase [Candidatus Dormibacteraeota bacterium]|jgi:LDH2 family malate/lactate/ureidoglycolate dehydrogenase|nr:Ldh family oxidoreductase [Candidatus Dormibacteraeota bacterium]